MRILCLFCLLALLACAGEEPARTPDAPATAPQSSAAIIDTAALAPMDCAEYIARALAVQPVRAALQERFGSADEVSSAVEPNRHVPDVTDSLFRVRYTGLEVEIRKPHGGDDMTERVHVTDNRFLTQAALGIGAPEARIRRILAEPFEGDAARLRYRCGETGETLTFELSGGQVNAVAIEYYVD